MTTGDTFTIDTIWRILSPTLAHRIWVPGPRGLGFVHLPACFLQGELPFCLCPGISLRADSLPLVQTKSANVGLHSAVEPSTRMQHLNRARTKTAGVLTSSPQRMTVA